MRETGFWFYGSFRDAAAHLQDTDRLALYDALVAYALDGAEPECGGVVGAMMALMKPNVDASKARTERNRENGKRGGRKSNRSETENNPEETQPNPNKRLINENENDKETDIGVPRLRTPRHKYGAYKHVMLSDQEIARLDDEYGHEVVKEAIRVVDEYCQTSGRRYKDYNLVIRNWGIERARGSRQMVKPNSFTAIQQNTYDYSKLENELLEN